MTICSSIKSKVALIGATLVVLLGINAYAIPSRPEPPRLVNDLTGSFTEEQAERLEQRLVAYSDSTSTQITVVLVNDLEGEEASSYATEIGEQWKVGSDKFDNGVVILVKPRNENGGGEVFIAVGYGLEGALPDARVKRIINEIMIPHLAEGDYFAAVDAACEKIISLADGEDFSSDSEDESSSIFGGLLFIALVGAIIFFAMRKPKNGGNGGSSNSSTGGAYSTGPIVTPSSFSGGSSSSKGGFGGFGGGSFGGAGAGGKF